MREVFVTRCDFAGLLDPVFAESTLQTIDDRAGDANRRIAPMIVVLRVALPLFRETETADVTDASIDDYQLAV